KNDAAMTIRPSELRAHAQPTTHQFGWLDCLPAATILTERPTTRDPAMLADATPALFDMTRQAEQSPSWLSAAKTLAEIQRMVRTVSAACDAFRERAEVRGSRRRQLRQKSIARAQCLLVSHPTRAA